MSLSNKELIQLPVYTKSETHLGAVDGFELDELSQRITRYFVKTKHGITGIFKHHLCVSRDQVISINREKMVVDDLVAKELASERDQVSSKAPLPASHT